MNRQQSIWSMEIAGYHNDQSARVRLLVEARVSRPVMTEAWLRGIRAKAERMGCACSACSTQGGK